MGLFREGDRTDWSPARPDEPLFDFLDRSATPFFTEVRRLLEDWLARVPSEHQPPLLGNAKAGDHAFMSVFWELYLPRIHRVVIGSGVP